MTGWEWFVLATAAGAVAYALLIGFVVLWSRDNKTAGQRWDQTTTDHHRKTGDTP